MGEGFLTGIEVDKKYDCQNLVVRNRSACSITFTLPGGRESVMIPEGFGLLCWMDKAFEAVEQWQYFRLKRS